MPTRQDKALARRLLKQKTRAREKRRSEIVRMLCALSRDGWQNAKHSDYCALERELAALPPRNESQ